MESIVTACSPVGDGAVYKRDVAFPAHSVPADAGATDKARVIGSTSPERAHFPDKYDSGRSQPSWSFRSDASLGMSFFAGPARKKSNGFPTGSSSATEQPALGRTVVSEKTQIRILA